MDEHFRAMSFEERVEKYKAYLNAKEIIEDFMERVQGDYEPSQNQDIK